MSRSGAEEDEQSAIKAIQKRFQRLNITLEPMNESLARNEVSEPLEDSLASELRLLWKEILKMTREEVDIGESMDPQIGRTTI